MYQCFKYSVLFPLLFLPFFHGFGASSQIVHVWRHTPESMLGPIALLKENGITTYSSGTYFDYYTDGKVFIHGQVIDNQCSGILETPILIPQKITVGHLITAIRLARNTTDSHKKNPDGRSSLKEIYNETLSQALNLPY